MRAIAVVFAFAQSTFLRTGVWMLSDLVFVLSAFLITTELRSIRNAPNFWTTFYSKRAARILFPLVVSLVAAAKISPQGWQRFGWLYAVSAAGVANTFFPPRCLSVWGLWSVAIVIHFYLLWPMFVRHLGRRALLWVCLLVVLSEPVVRGFGMLMFHSFWAVYYLTPFRLDSLAAGALLSLLLETNAPRQALTKLSGGAAAVLGIALACLVPFSFLQRNSPGSLFNPIGYLWLAAIFFFLIAFVALHPGSKLSNLLSFRPLVSLGKISYGFYLYHPVVIWFIDRTADFAHVPHWKALTIVSFVISYGISWLSFYLIESRLMSWNREKLRMALGYGSPAEAIPTN